MNSHCCLCKVLFQPCLPLKEKVKKTKIKTDTRERHLKDSGNIFERRLAQRLVFVWKTRGVQGRELDFETVMFRLSLFKYSKKSKFDELNFFFF